MLLIYSARGLFSELALRRAFALGYFSDPVKTVAHYLRGPFGMSLSELLRT